MEHDSTNMTEKPNPTLPAGPYQDAQLDIINNAHVSLDNIVNFLRARLHPGEDLDKATSAILTAKSAVHQAALSARPVLFGEQVDNPDTPLSLPNEAHTDGKGPNPSKAVQPGGPEPQQNPAANPAAQDRADEYASKQVTQPVGSGKEVQTQAPLAPLTEQDRLRHEQQEAGKPPVKPTAPAKSPATGNPQANPNGPEAENGK